MADAGFFKGTSAEQDSRFANKQKKLLKQMKFPDNIDVKIDILKISLDVIKPWITKRLQELLGIEDDVVIEFVFNQLEEKNPDPKMMQINLTGFLGGSKARLFISELWKLLASAQSSADGIPAELVEMKKNELLKRQQEDDRLREIRKREEETLRQEIKPDVEKSNPGRNGTTSTSNNKSRHENGNSGGYRTRTNYDNRRRSPDKTRPESNTRRPEKKSRRSVSSSSDDDDRKHRQIKTKPSTNRHRSPSQSPVHNRKPEKPPQRDVSASSTASDRSQKKSKKSTTKSVATSKKNKKTSKRTRSSSTSASRSSSSSSSSVVEIKKQKKSKRSPSPVRNRKSDKKKDDHRSRKSSKSSSRKHHRNHENKRKSHRDHTDKSKTKKSHRSESSDHEIRTPSPPKKPRLESQIRVQTPPPPPAPPVDDHRIEQQVVPIKPNRIERIVVLEESRVATRVPMKSKSTFEDEQPPPPPPPKNNYPNSSEDENEIDLRERLLREKAIKSMRRRQLSNDHHDKTTTSDRIVYETQ